jgi:hypothetical protein
MTNDQNTIQSTFNRITKTQLMTPEEQGFLMRWISQPENKEKYHLTTELHEDRIGKYRILTKNPRSEDRETVKIYLLPKDRRDLTEFRLQYYDILRAEKSNTYKAMRLALLAKNLEYAFAQDLKVNEHTGKFAQLHDLLGKIKKARSYYSYKTFLDGKIISGENDGEKPQIRTLNANKVENASRPDDRGLTPEESPSTKEQDAG